MSHAGSGTIGGGASGRGAPECEVAPQYPMNLGPLSTSVESLPSDPEPPDEVVLGRARPGVWGSARPRVFAGLRRPPRPRTVARVQTALLEGLGDLPTDARAGAASKGVLWVSGGVTEGSLPPQLSVEPLDLATVDAGPQLPFEMVGASAGCILNGVLERADDPDALLAWAYQRLQPGGRLALSVRDVRNMRPRKLHSLAAGDPTRVRLFPRETLQSLLFQHGFDEPRLRRCGSELIASARRSPLPPPPQRRQRLSVIMPVYNEARTLDEALAVVVAKEIPGVDIDIIIVESNSTDGSREKVLEYSEHPRVHVILEFSAPRQRSCCTNWSCGRSR